MVKSIVFGELNESKTKVQLLLVSATFPKVLHGCYLPLTVLLFVIRLSTVERFLTVVSL